MTQKERQIYQVASLERESSKLRNDLQILQSWLKVNNSAIWDNFKEFQASEINSKSLK